MIIKLYVSVEGGGVTVQLLGVAHVHCWMLELNVDGAAVHVALVVNDAHTAGLGYCTEKNNVYLRREGTQKERERLHRKRKTQVNRT